MRKPQILTILALASICALPVRADITYQYVTDQTSYTAAAGQTVTVQLLLQETITGASSSLILAENGLFGAGVFVTQSGTVPSNPTLIAGPVSGNKATVPNGFGPGGTFSSVPATTTSAGILESLPTGVFVGPTGTVVNATTRDVLLGTLAFTAGAAGTTTQFTIESYRTFSGADGNTLTGTHGYDLDVFDSNSGSPTYTGADAFKNTFTVNVPSAASPEPGTLLLTASGAFLLAGGAWRRRRAKGNQADLDESTPAPE